MTTQPLKLLTPYLLGETQLENRVVMAPMTRARSGDDRIPNDLMARYYTQRASAGLIVTEATSISPQGLGWSNTPGIYNQQQVDGWKRIVDSVHREGGKIYLQLWHCGRASHTSFHPELGLPVAPSSIAIQGDQIHTPTGKQPYEVPRALELSELPGIVNDYRNAAEGALAAGFDGVEIHGANGYLLDQFLQDKTNQRQDAYGGSVENRSRLLLEVTEAICSVCPRNLVGVRLSPNGAYNDMGDSNPRSIFLYVAAQLNQMGIGYLHIMDGLGFGFHGNGEPMVLKEFRGVFDGALIGNVGYSPESAEAALVQNEADLIAFGRPYITNPDLVERFRNNYPLTSSEDMTHWYSPGELGYTDYPAFHREQPLVR